MHLSIPEPALVLLIGPSGSGKSTFATAHFKATEILSSDVLRAALTDDPADQGASAEAFRVLSMLANGRLRRRLTTVIDATNLHASNRRQYTRLAARYGIATVAIAFDFPADRYAAHNRQRPDRVVDQAVVADQTERMRETMAALATEKLDHSHVLTDPAAVAFLTVQRLRQPNRRGDAPRRA